jgi:hypothetical protein
MADITSNGWTHHDASWCPSLSFTLRLLPSVLIKRSTCLQLRVRDTAQPAPLFFCWVTPEFPHPNPLHARSVRRAGLRNHRLHSDTCSGVRAIRFLGSVSATARFFLVTADILFFFLGSSTFRWTFEGLHCEHRPASTVVWTSSNALCRLVRVEQPVPWAWVPPQGILLILLSLRFLCS